MFEGRDELAITQEDIKRALGRPSVEWAMLIDLRRCVLCHACTAGCMAEQKSPPGIVYRPVYEEEMGVYPKVKRRFTPRPCLQCDDPPCVEACPHKGEGKATWKSKGGISAGTSASIRPALWALKGLLYLVGRSGLFPQLAHPLRRWISGGYLYRGYRRGLRDFGMLSSPHRLSWGQCRKRSEVSQSRPACIAKCSKSGELILRVNGYE